MEAFKLMAGGAIFGVVASCWATIKGYIWRFFNLFLQDVEVQDADTVNAVVGFLVSNYKKVGLYDKVYTSYEDFIRSEKRNGRIPLEHFGGKSMIFRKGIRFLYFQTTSPTQPATTTSGYNSGGTQVKPVCYFIFLRGTFDFDEIVSQAMRMHNEVAWATLKTAASLRKRFFVKYLPDIAKDEGMTASRAVTNWQYQKNIRLLDRDPSDIGMGTSNKVSMLERLFFPDEIIALIEEIKVWRKSRNIYQEIGIPWKRGWLFHGPGGTGKCLGKDTPILMYDGSLKMVQDVSVGDLLMGPDSAPRRVLSLARGREEMYRVVPVKGDSYVVNKSHILSLKMTIGAGGHKKGAIVNISVEDYLSSSANFRRHANGWRTKIEFADKDLPMDPYLMGLWFGNGHIHKCNFTILHPEVVQEMSRIVEPMGISVNFIEEAGQANIYSVGKPGTGQTLVGENPFRNTLVELGLFGNSKFIPDIYKINSREVLLEVLAGVIDTDGHLDYCNCYDIVLKEERLAADVVFIARSLGFAAYMKPCKKSIKSTGFVGDYFRISISGNLDSIPVRVPYKKAAPRRQKKDVLVTGIDLESLGDGEYYGFEIDGDRLFVLGDFTVTHNTALASAFAHDLDMPIFVFNLSELSNMEFMREWKKMLTHVPCIALIEDIDNVFHGRRNITRGDDNFSFGRMFSQIDKGPLKKPAAVDAVGKLIPEEQDEVSRRYGMSLSFDVLLNCLDGVDRCEGLFTIITTNHIEHIDPALGQPIAREDGTQDFISSRPGRIDKAIRLGQMEHYVKERMAKHILGRWPVAYEEFIHTVRAQRLEETPAQFQERCSQVALKAFWKELEETTKKEQEKVTIPMAIRSDSHNTNGTPRYAEASA